MDTVAVIYHGPSDAVYGAGHLFVNGEPTEISEALAESLLSQDTFSLSSAPEEQ